MEIPGGRPKAIDMWEHVWVLEGKKKVKCKHCGFEFAASANRIKSHIHQIKGQGIRPCPNPKKIIRDSKEKENLHDSQGPRDYNKLNERMFNCYVSPKTMWEGIKSLQQLQTRTEDMHQERIKVGPFWVSNMVNESDLRLIQYVFEHSSERCILFKSSRSFLCQSQMTTLRPQTHLDSWVIDIFADILTDNERRKKSKPLNWYLPVMFSSAALNSDVSSFLDFVERQKMRENYMFDNLEYCAKIFIPVRVEKHLCGHYYLYIIHIKNREVEIWDSLCDQFMDKTEHDQMTQKLLLAMDRLFEDVMFAKFYWRMASNIPLQPNGYDCGIFVINYMKQSDNFVRQKPLFQFDSDEERLDLILKLLKNDLNQEKEKLYDEAARRHNAQIDSEEDLYLYGIKRKRVDTCKTIFEDVGRGAYVELDDSINRVKRNKVALETERVKGYIMPMVDLVGYEFQRHTQQIWDWIMKNEVSVIGIWGMGGAGKTALATHVHNKLLEEVGDDFDHIIWVTVSQYNNGIYKLQKAIARSINIDISGERDVKRLSGKLLQAFKHINRCVLILDDVWDPILLEEVGFPVSNNGIKLIVTTRLWQVCQSMNCMKNVIEVKPPSEDNGWDLFKKTLGVHQIQLSGVELIARAVAKQLGGLPHALVTIARSMKGKEHIRKWNHLMECLQNLDNVQYHIDERVFSVLKSSYACLNNKLQKFFLHYALRAKKDVIDSYVEPLVRSFFYEVWTDETKSLEMQYNEGYTMLDELNNNSLLIREHGGWRMHTLIRVMAINIAKDTEEIMAKPGVNLTELPKNGEWKENLQKVCLTQSNIQYILDGTSPKCSKLSTLLLDCNYGLKWIPDDFFSNMPALKILDLSRTGIERLPESVSNLEFLFALLLSECEKLSYVPSLAKLQRLIELDLSLTAITEAPCGLELLVNLKCLNLSCTEQLKMSSSIISKMTNLQSLRLTNRIPKSMDVSVKDLQCLRKLEVISINFSNIEEFNAYVKSFRDKHHVLKSYCISSAMLFHHCTSFGFASEAYSLKRVVLCGIDLSSRVAVLPEDMNELIINECHLTRTTCMCHALSFHKYCNNLTKIECLVISGCKKIEYLCCASLVNCFFCSCVQLVQTLSLFALEDLKQIVSPFALYLNNSFPYLKHLLIRKCSRMKILITPELLAELQNLETISVGSCVSMEEIFGVNYCISNTFNPTITLPKVRYVELVNLPELSFVFIGTMLCPSLEHFESYDCKILCPPHIEIVEGCKLGIVEIWTGRYLWKRDNQAPTTDFNSHVNELSMQIQGSSQAQPFASSPLVKSEMAMSSYELSL